MNRPLWLAVLVFYSGCACAVPLSVRNLNPDLHRQAVVVIANARHPQAARVSLWQWQDSHWQKLSCNIRAVIGRNGLAPQGQKKEGDGRTPSGTYDLGPAFGYSTLLNTRLAYRQAGYEDFWVDDPASAQYNQWVHGPVPAGSYEKLRRDDDLYKLAIVVQYNTGPVVPGDGSAIFLHIWRRWDHPTAGCIAVSQRNARRILRRLNQSDHPAIILEKGRGDG